MEFYNIIEQRESVRSYDPHKKVPKTVLDRIMNAGRLAPSAANRQPWTFVLVSSEEKLKEVKACYKRQWFRDAPYVLVVTGNKTKTWIRSYDDYNPIETDLAIAMDHMILATENEGVGACWIIDFDYEKLTKAIGLKKNEVVYCITPLGYQPEGYKKRGNKIRKSLDEVVRRI